MISQKPWQLEATLQLVLRLFLCFLVGAVLATLARKWLGNQTVEQWQLNVVIATVSMQGCGLVLIVCFLREHNIGWLEAFNFRAGWRRALGVGLLLALAAVPATWIFQWVSVEVLTWLHYPVQTQEAIRLLQENQSPGKVIYLAVVAMVFAPLVEEMLFRGILYPVVKQLGRPRLALWGTAIMFALMHFNAAIFLPLVFLAVMLTLLYEWTNNLLAPILVHSLFNAANFTALYYGWVN